MQRALATSLIGLTLGWGGLFPLPGYKPFVVQEGYKPYVYVDGYKPFVEGKGNFKPTSSRRSSSSSSRAPFRPKTCGEDGWILPMLIRGNEPLTFCMIDAPIGWGGGSW